MKAKRNVPGILHFFESVARRWGSCVHNMFIAKANAKENVGEFICLAITKANAREKPRFAFVMVFCAEGKQFARWGVGVEAF